MSTNCTFNYNNIITIIIDKDRVTNVTIHDNLDLNYADNSVICVNNVQ